jgi:hypothetical protein
MSAARGDGEAPDAMRQPTGRGLDALLLEITEGDANAADDLLLSIQDPAAESVAPEDEPDEEELEDLPVTDDEQEYGMEDAVDPVSVDEPPARRDPPDATNGRPPAAAVAPEPAARAKDITDQPPWGFYLVCLSLLIALAAFIVSVYHYSQAKDVVTVMGVLTGIIGALVGAYFGIRGATYAQLVARDQTQAAAEPSREPEHHRDAERHDRDGQHRDGHRADGHHDGDRHDPRRARAGRSGRDD